MPDSHAPAARFHNARPFAPAALVAVLLTAIRPLIAHDYLLFHSLVEIGAATISFGTFLFAWNTRRFQNSFLRVLGVGALFVGMFEALHCLAYPGMSVFHHYDDNLSPQLWLCARLFQAGATLAGLALIGRRLKTSVVLSGGAVAFVAVCGAVFLGYAPRAVGPGGLTPVKVTTEWMLVVAFLASIAMLWRNRARFSERVFRFLVANAAAMAAGEVCFTLYSRPYDTTNFLGHVLLVCAVYWQYQAILETGLTDPNQAQFRDLTRAREESELAKARLREANESLVAADRRKDDFLAMLSHELRNPLAPIAASVWVLERAEPEGEQARRARDVLARQVRHMTRLVDDLLDITRISRGKIRLQREPVDLSALVLKVGEDHRSVLSEKGLRFEVAVSTPPLLVDGDPVRLAQVVGNLLQNAAKFTPNGGSVTLSLALDDGGFARVSVSDTGAGIAPENQARVFEPFVQADSTLEQSVGGLGLGLALVKGLVTLHGGSVSVHSDGPDRGAEFVVCLPVVGRAGAGAVPAGVHAV